MQIHVNLTDALTREKIRLDLPCTFTFGIGAPERLSVEENADMKDRAFRRARLAPSPPFRRTHGDLAQRSVRSPDGSWILRRPPSLCLTTRPPRSRCALARPLRAPCPCPHACAQRWAACYTNHVRQAQDSAFASRDRSSCVLFISCVGAGSGHDHRPAARRDRHHGRRRGAPLLCRSAPRTLWRTRARL